MDYKWIIDQLLTMLPKIFMMWFSFHLVSSSPVLGTRCIESNDCSSLVANSYCTEDICECENGFRNMGDTYCKARHIGDPCIYNSDCSNVVSNSSCVSDRCTCDEGSVAFNASTCFFGRLSNSILNEIHIYVHISLQRYTVTTSTWSSWKYMISLKRFLQLLDRRPFLHKLHLLP